MIYDKLKQYKQKRTELKHNYGLSSKDRWGLLQKTYLLQKEELQELQKLPAFQERNEKKQAIRKEFPFRSWVHR